MEGTIALPPGHELPRVDLLVRRDGVDDVPPGQLDVEIDQALRTIAENLPLADKPADT
jgi:hypothetical protein